MNIYRRLLGYIKPYRWRLVVAILCMLGFSLANSLVSATLYIIVNGLYHKNQVILDNIPNVPLLSSVSFPVSWIPFIMIAVFLLRGVFDYVSNYQMSNLGIRAIRKVRDDLYRHLVYLSHDFYAKGRTGDFLSRIINDVGQIQGAITDVIVDLVKQPLVIYSISLGFLSGAGNTRFLPF